MQGGQEIGLEILATGTTLQLGNLFPAPGLASSRTANRITLDNKLRWPPLTGGRFGLKSTHVDPPPHNPMPSGAHHRPGADMVGAGVGAVEGDVCGLQSAKGAQSAGQVR